jgi:hypothetical protein
MAQNEHTSATRRELLAELPEHERARYADVPILSASDAELRRLVGDRAGDAHLVVIDGQAVVVVRETAPPSAGRPLLGEIQERVFPHMGGMTLEGALPPHLRDVPIRREPSLRADEVRINLDPPGHGPIRSIEITVGPTVRPVDIALHSDAIARVKRWTGLVGEARLALADAGHRLGVQVESPRDRARFEAAGELAKLGPIIEERIRRAPDVIGDPRATELLNGQVQNLLAQQEHARRILAGDVHQEPRGYIAAEAAPVAPPEHTSEKAAGTEREGSAKTPTAATAATPGPSAKGPTDPAATHKLANDLMNQISGKEQNLKYHEGVARQARSSIENDAAWLHDQLKGQAETRWEIVRRDEFKQRFTGTAAGFEAAAGSLRAELTGKPQLLQAVDRMVEQRAKIATADGYRDKLAETITTLRGDLEKLPRNEVAAAERNQNLTHERLALGPEAVCFPPETPVATPNGAVPIAQLRAGDLVLAADPGRPVPRPARVERTYCGRTDWLVEITTDAGTVRATRDHRFWTGKEWLPARLLMPGTALAVLSGTQLAVQRCARIDVETETWSLEVERDHTFYAGDCGALVHNGRPEPPRNYKSEIRYTAEIYYVSIRVDGQWRVAYVGSTNAEGLAFARFKQHLAEGIRDAVSFKVYKEQWPSLFGSPKRVRQNAKGGTWGLGVWEQGSLKVEVRERHVLSDIELAIREQAHININNHGKLVNQDPACSEKMFKDYYDPKTQRPCL